MDYTKLINPKNGELVHLFNKDGKQLLKRYINNYKSGGADVGAALKTQRETDFKEIVRLAKKGKYNEIVNKFRDKKKLWFSERDPDVNEEEEEEEEEDEDEE